MEGEASSQANVCAGQRDSQSRQRVLNKVQAPLELEVNRRVGAKAWRAVFEVASSFHLTFEALQAAARRRQTLLATPAMNQHRLTKATLATTDGAYCAEACTCAQCVTLHAAVHVSAATTNSNHQCSYAI